MITGFDQITAELSAEEKKIVPILVKGFNLHIGKENAIKAPVIISSLEHRVGIKITQVRLRKLVNFMRRHGILPIIATSEGYYVTQDKEEILKQMKSLEERAAAIIAARDGLEKFIIEI